MHFRMWLHTMRSSELRNRVRNTYLWRIFASSLYAGWAMAQEVEEGSGMADAPWESALCGVASWFQGPTPLAVGTIAFGVAGASFVFGEELSGILRKIINITMGICLSVGGATLLGWIAEKMNATVAACAL